MRELVNEILTKLDPEIKYSLEAENLILGTGAHESMGWAKRKQMGSGPALGLFQMEPATFNDIVNNYLKYHPNIVAKIKQISRINVFSSVYLINNDALAICMCRIHYLRVTEPLPNNLPGWAAYWKKWYNTPLGKGTEQQFINDFNRYIKGIS